MCIKYNLGFCDDYAYPLEIKNHFKEILDHLDPKRVLSVLLTGSACRGELSYIRENSKILIFSDYEFFVIAKDIIPHRSDVLRLRNKYRELERRIGSDSPLFHIDFSYAGRYKLRRLPCILRTYETKANGITIYGEDLIEEIPDVNLGNLDFKELNEILIWRLWAMLLYLPAEWVLKKRMSTYTERLYKYVLCRNALDIATWLLPKEGVLLPSYRERADFIESHFSNLKFRHIMGEDFPTFLRECLVGKLKLRFERPIAELYSEVVKYFLKAGMYLLNVNDESDMYKVLEDMSHTFFQDRTLNRKGYELLLLIRQLPKRNIKESIKWFFSGKHGLLLSVLYNMHLAFLASLNGNAVEQSYRLNLSSQLLQRLHFGSPLIGNSADLSARWLFLREEFAKFMMDYFIWIGHQRQHVESILKGQWART